VENYQPFLIADFKTGLDLGIEPWLLPKDAFATFEDGFIHRGAIEKREGYSKLVATEETGAITGIFSRIEESDGTKTLLVTDIDWLYKYNTTLGVLSKVFHSTDTVEACVFEDTVGCEWTDTAGCEFTTLYDYGENFSGDSTNLVDWENLNGVVYMTDNAGVLQSYDGTTFQEFKPEVAGGADYVNKAAHIMVSHERVILFNTDETTDGRRAQRARWCKPVTSPGAALDFTNDGWVDAPTSEWIRGATYFKNDIIVWFDKSVWFLRYTGNYELPFRWEKISGIDGCSAPFSAVEFQDQGMALGKSGLIFCDGLQVQSIVSKIPDLSLAFSSKNIETCYSAVFEDLKQLWTLYPYSDATQPNRVLVLQYEDWSWSIYNLSFQCLGFYESSDTLTWEEVTETWVENNTPWVSNTAQSEYPVALAGDNAGTVWKLNNTGTDGASSAIGFKVMSGQWNPFKEKGLKTRFGYVDFLVSTGDYELDVDFFKDMDTVAWKTETLDFNQGGDKAWVRIFVNAVSNFHRLQIRTPSSGVSNQSIKIHAIRPWFAQAGRTTI